jgi:hypothetical protein
VIDGKNNSITEHKFLMDDSSYRLEFDPDKKGEIYYYSLKEHP